MIDSSFCEEHRPSQELNRRRRRFRFVGTARTQCAICMQPIATRTSANTLGTPCCKKFFHRECMQVSAPGGRTVVVSYIRRLSK